MNESPDTARCLFLYSESVPARERENAGNEWHATGMKDFHFVIDLAERDRTSAGGRIFVPQTNIFFSLLLWPWGRIY